MRIPYDNRELDALAERFHAVQRVRFGLAGHKGRITFEQFLANPEAYEALARIRLLGYKKGIQMLKGTSQSLIIN